ncbi:hypothetical protein [Oceanisphaera sp. IT1-181]|uniref:hypothetical protein n=1 Tax=Oceanisphaera sp. IT1-181 TaxID=3081199 RepID=UPI0029C9EADF|nr:hypothetical protein [Oceanisphaera sp. IT1-181]
MMMNEPRFARLQQSLQQGFTLEPKAIFKEGWARINGAKMPLILAALGVAGFWLVLSQVSTRLVPNPEEASWQLSLLGLLVSMGLAPMTAALDMMGIARSVDKPIRPNQIFNYFGSLVPLAAASLLMGILSAALMAVIQMLGLPAVLTMLPMLLLSVALMFTFPLILEKGFTPLQAIMTSLKLFSRQWLQLLAIQVFFILMFIVAILSLGIALIWVAPLFMVVKGIIYREVCGVEGETDNKDAGLNSDVLSAQPPSLNSSKDKFEA